MHTAPRGALTETTPDGARWWWDGHQWHRIVPWPPWERRTITLARRALAFGVVAGVGALAVLLALVGQGPEPAQPLQVGPGDAVLGALWVSPAIVLGLVVLARRPPTSAARAAALSAVLLGLGSALITVGVPLNLLWVAST